MIFASHFLFGVLWALLATGVLNPRGEQVLLYIPLSALGAVFPDVDEPESYIGRCLRPLRMMSGLGAALCSAKNKSGFGFPPGDHRGLTHSLLGALLGAAPLYLFNETASLFFSLGWLSHIAADMLTPHGVPLFYPLGKRIRAPCRLPTGSPRECVFFTAPVAIAILVYSYILLNTAWEGLGP